MPWFRASNRQRRLTPGLRPPPFGTLGSRFPNASLRGPEGVKRCMCALLTASERGLNSTNGVDIAPVLPKRAELGNVIRYLPTVDFRLPIHRDRQSVPKAVSELTAVLSQRNELITGRV
jgi:hypothetical protein